MLAIELQPVPLTIDTDGTVRVSRTRIPLDTIVSAFLNGDTAEEIVKQYPVLNLADVYAVISFYLKNEAEVHRYLLERKEQSEEIRQRVEERCNPTGIRQRLLNRKLPSGK